MKKIILLLSLILAVSAVQGEDLQPSPSDQAIQQYQEFWKSDTIDVMNHVVWKIYIFRAVPSKSVAQGSMQYIIAGLTPFPRKSYYVGLKINQLYNFVSPVPKRGDVLLVSGRITSRRDYRLTLPNKEVPIKLLTMDLDGASIQPGEHFDPAATPTPGPGKGN